MGPTGTVSSDVGVFVALVPLGRGEFVVDGALGPDVGDFVVSGVGESVAAVPDCVPSDPAVPDGELSGDDVPDVEGDAG
ncbi:MAG: hypothetical protein MUE31_08975 [Candidatus Nanopelagicales bacterium]|jgi:hypothetical protein|nr:hypothetical protein [Candidatus Nanopelagicales bacterium]